MKRRYIVYIEVEPETLLKASNQEYIEDALRKEITGSKSNGIDIKSIINNDDSYDSRTADLPLYITVVNGKITEIWFDSHYDNQDYCLNDNDFSVTYKRE